MQQQFTFDFEAPSTTTPAAILTTELGPLPVRSRPLPDESMSSWILRVLSGNWLKTKATSKYFFDSSHILAKDLDRAPPAKLIKYAQRISGVTDKELESLLLIGEREHIFEYANDMGSTPYITALWRFVKQKEVERGLAYCPDCLREDLIPYFRKSWRYSFVTTCSRHKRLLEDQCPHCGEYFQHSAGAKYGPQSTKIDQMTCAFCFRSILSAQTERNDSPEAIAEADFISSRFLDAKSNKWVALNNGQTIHPIAWAQGVRDLQRYIAQAHMSDVSLMMLARHGAIGFMSLEEFRLYTHGREEIDPDNFPASRCQWMFEHCDVRTRAHVNSLVAHMLNNRWPESFVSSLEDEKARRHWKHRLEVYGSEQNKRMPYWIESVIPEVLGNKHEHARHRRNYRDGVCQHLKAKGYVVNSDSVRRFIDLGVYPSKTVAETRATSNYREMLYSLLGPKPNEPKAAWLNDKSSPYCGVQHIGDSLS
jgi:hypothetical protein